MRAYGLARLTKDIEKVSDNLYRVLLAENIYNSQTKEQDGHFWNAIAFGKKGEALFNSVHKGDRINITNSIMKNNNYEKDGVMKYGTQMVIFDFDFIEKKGTNNDQVSFDFSAVGYYLPFNELLSLSFYHSRIAGRYPQLPYDPSLQHIHRDRKPLFH